MRTQRYNDMGMINFGMAILGICFLFYLWYTAHADIVYVGMQWVWHQLAIFDWPLTRNIISRWQQEVIYFASNSDVVSFEKFLYVLNRTGYLFIWIPLFLTVRGITLAIKHKANKTRRKITAETLPWVISKHSPAIIPSLYYGDRDNLLLNTNPEEHRSAISPQEWVEHHGLVVNGVLDRAHCHQLLVADLGQPISSIDELKPYEKTMFAIFGGRIFSETRDLERTQNLLDDLNRSCHHHRWNGEKGYPDLSLANKDFVIYLKDKRAEQWLKKHPYPRTLLHSMHKTALLSGKLPSSHFRWLKGMDRLLWYALNTTGRKAPFIESAAVFSQALWEDFAFNNGYKLVEPCINDAIDGIDAYLIKIGLIAAPQKRDDKP
ncbi:MAG: conjugal transfer protein TrbA [Ottowia sp.]|nr:conjugal transfer protein TrbA [Ottowia sp.]